MAVTVAPITDADTAAVGRFLTEQLNPRVTPTTWADAVDTPWAVERPNAGFMLLDDDRVVGVHLAFYSERTVAGNVERFCNLGAWCVHPDYRLHGMRLLKALLAQDGYHFTDLSPSGNVVPINEKLRFAFLDTETALTPNLPWPSLPGRTRILTDPDAIEAALTGDDLALYHDHAHAAAAHHLVLRRGERTCYVIFRKDRRKDLPLFASILHVSDPELYRQAARPLARHLLVRHRTLATLGERRVTGGRPAMSYTLKEPRRKMFRSDSLGPHQIDDLYSELVCLPW
jgi:GNAT superfamily N-acetyltransferase